MKPATVVIFLAAAIGTFTFVSYFLHTRSTPPPSPTPVPAPEEQPVIYPNAKG